MALTVALGVTLGILPVLWGTTILCAGAAFFFRLNQTGIQLVNYTAYPLQLVLLLPFYRLGERLFPSIRPTATGAEAGHLSGIFSQLGVLTLKAVMAWLLTAPAVMLVLYGMSMVFFRRRNKAA